MGIKGSNRPDGYNKTPESFGETLNAFAQYVADNFATSKDNHQRSRIMNHK